MKGTELENRIVLTSMGTGSATLKGEVTNGNIDHYAKRSTFLGLLIVEHSYVTLNGKLGAKQIGIHDSNLIGGLKKLSDKIHAADTLAIIQINHAGRSANIEITGEKPIAPSFHSGAMETQIQ